MNNIAIIIPFFNEYSRIGDGKYLIELSSIPGVDFYYVNDGSKDATLNKLKVIAQITNASIINLKHNSGKGEAIRRGLANAISYSNYDLLGYLDSDGAFPLSQVVSSFADAQSCLSSMKNVDIYIASRVKLAGKQIHRNLLRHYLSRLILSFIGFGIPNMPYDSQSGLKILRNSARLKRALDDSFRTRWFFDLELMSRLGMTRKSCLWEEPVDSWFEIPGSKLRFKSVIQVLKEIITVRHLLKKPSY
jgi:glycosyltransferase involved in cell wall biosynthesis